MDLFVDFLSILKEFQRNLAATNMPTSERWISQTTIHLSDCHFKTGNLSFIKIQTSSRNKTFYNWKIAICYQITKPITSLSMENNVFLDHDAIYNPIGNWLWTISFINVISFVSLGLHVFLFRIRQTGKDKIQLEDWQSVREISNVNKSNK